MSQIFTAGERPDAWTMIGDVKRRVEKLEAVPVAGAGVRFVYGRVLEDGGILNPGSGDWSSSWDVPNNWIAITITPAFTTGFVFTALPNDSGNPYATAPALGPIPSAESGFLKGIQASLGLVNVAMWDLDGNFAVDNNFGFDFLAVGV